MKVKTNEKSISVDINRIYKEITNDIKLTAILNKVYSFKMSNEMVNTKVKNQLNSINFSIAQINPKFSDKSKNYGKVSNIILITMSEYENILKQLCDSYDEKINELIYKKVEIENKILLNIINESFSIGNKPSIKKKITKTVNSAIDKIKGKIKKNEVIDVGLINKLQDGQDVANEISDSENVNQNITVLNDELIDINKKIQQLNKEKENQIMNALENGEKEVSTDLKKPRSFKKLTKFFANRFNTYNVIMKTVITPINQRIGSLQESVVQDEKSEEKEIDLADFLEKIKEIQKNVLNKEINKEILEKIENVI